MRTLAIAASIATVILFLCPTSALADAPVREPDMPLDATFAPGEVCAFAVHLESIADSGTMTTFSDGHVQITGRFIVRVTDLETGGWIDVNASGPLFLWFEADGTTTFVTHGTYLWILNEGDIGGPGLLYTTGRGTATVDQDFVLTAFHQSGTSIDLCSAVAAA